MSRQFARLSRRGLKESLLCRKVLLGFAQEDGAAPAFKHEFGATGVERAVGPVASTKSREAISVVRVTTGVLRRTATSKFLHLGVKSQCEVGRVTSKDSGVLLPLRAAKFMRCQAAQPLEPLGVVVGQ